MLHPTIETLKRLITLRPLATGACLACACCLLVLPRSRAQDVDPFAEEPVAGARKSQDDKGGDSAAKLPIDPAVRDVLETNPSLPVDLLHAAIVLIDLGHAAEAAPLVEKLAAFSPNDEELA